MPSEKVEGFEGNGNLGVTSGRRRNYLPPALKRFGTLSELTMAGGNKVGNDSPIPAPGCGARNFTTSCIRPS